MSEKGDGASSVWKGTMVVLLLVLIALLGNITYQVMFNGENPFKGKEVEVNLEQSPEVTIETRMAAFNAEVKDTELKDLYLSLPPMIVQTILERVGVEASYQTVALEYQKNREYYISVQISNLITPELTGPDANNVEKVEIKTTVKEPIAPTTKVALTPSDSIIR